MAWSIRTVCDAMSVSFHPKLDACEILKVNSISPKKKVRGGNVALNFVLVPN